MGYLSKEEISKIGFKSFGENLEISSKAIFYRPERISLGSNIKIDDFAVLANHITLGNYIHISIGSYLLSSSNAEIIMKDFSGLAPRAHLFTSSDDYSGKFMTNPTLPDEYCGRYEKSLTLGEHSIVGTCSIIFPGANLAIGTAVGAMSLIRKPTKEWSIYFGNPARRISQRSKNILNLQDKFLNELQKARL
ncbi:acyltransferase [Helicobacter sp. MIT 14-3879]|uniref:acyltransferase n=1 Tax=Helicobacter sp. MIT 14-3879 TaxID=2040649 RepID=UPI000E1F3031|nr:acyltransferase [Helicobacter sp. MIT 14-3879]RDU64786.1 O-acetyltransferase [Helicobacter sp. MIT 14-3879]